MCGVTGAYLQPDGLAVGRRMLERIAHRGPDACGLVEVGAARGPAVLGHRRLSIIDTSAASDQPFTKHGLTLSYNGEIYNYRELRTELERGGATFRTRSDTEVVIEAWRAWGTSAPGRFRGMFAFALHDQTSGALVLARDPLGIKPLYVMHRGDGVLFASELKAIIAAVPSELSVDPSAMVASALYYWVPEDFCSVRQVHKLPAGTWAEYRPDGSRVSGVYWDARAPSG